MSLKELKENNNKSPMHIIHNGKDITSQKEIADIMAQEFINKVENIRDKVRGNSYMAINTFKSLIPRVEETWRMCYTTVEEVYEHLQRMKKTNACGNDEITLRIMKEMPSYISLSTCHLFNAMVRYGKFPEQLKIVRMTPIHKQGKLKPILYHTDP